MVCLTKEEVSDYLGDYATFILQIEQQEDINIGFIASLMEECKVFKYTNFNGNFNTMIRISNLMNLLKEFSIIEQNFIDSLNDSDLDFTCIKDKLNGNFSNKQIIKFVRDAISHGENKELYQISRNGKFIEINLSNINFHLKLSIQDINYMIDEILKNINIVYLSGIDDSNFNYLNPWKYSELNKLKIVRIYLPKKIDNNTRKELFKVTSNTFYEYENINRALNVLDKNNIKYIIKKENLDIEQINKLKDMLVNIKGTEHIQKYRDNNMNLRLVFRECIHDTVPLSVEKLDDIRFSLLFNECFLKYHNMSFNGIYQELININKGMSNHPSSNIFCYIYKNNDPLSISVKLSKCVEDTSIVRNNAIIEYIKYTLVNMKESTININGTIYNKNTIRNSLVHNRYFIKDNESLELYDTKNGIKHDYEFHTHISIDIGELFKYIREYNNYETIAYQRSRIQ